MGPRWLGTISAKVLRSVNAVFYSVTSVEQAIETLNYSFLSLELR